MSASIRYCLVVYTLITLPLLVEARSNFRPYDGSPIITTNWVGEESTYHLEDSHLEIYALKTFDEDYFFNHMLPEEPFPFRYYPEQKMDPAILQDALDRLFYEVRRQQKRFTDFEVLKEDGFNRRKKVGLLVVKGKHWPLDQFVVKLFLETPHSFIRAYNKGFIAACHFIVGHGATRYMLGFTRLKNLEVIQRILAAHPFWAHRTSTPRKWFWIPRNYPWIHFSGYNMSGYDFFEFESPGAYAIVADAVRIKREFSIKNMQERKIGVELCNVLDCQVDPHSNNFVIEDLSDLPENHPIFKEMALSSDNTDNLNDVERLTKNILDVNHSRIVIIDTEHLPTMIGLKEPMKVESYRQWYTKLFGKGVDDAYLSRSRTNRTELHAKPVPPYQGPEKFITQECRIAIPA